MSEWADRYRVLTARAGASIPGRYRTSRVPYARAIMDALNDREHRFIAFQKPVQCGGSELGRNALGCWVDTDPGPVLIVFPDEAATKETISKAISPMFQDSPQLRQHLTGRPWDMKRGEISLRSCTIYAGWAGSPQALASRSIRYVILDEVDKFPRYSGRREADALSLAKERVTTWRDRAKVYAISTPTVPTGPIAKAIESCGDIRDFCVPCPHCTELLQPKWDRVRWQGMQTTDEDALRGVLRRLEMGETVPVYECQACKADISPEQWQEAIKRGEWVTEGWEPGTHPPSKSVGFRLSGLCSPWLGLVVAAVKFTQARLAGLGAMHSFFNSTLGVPFWDEDSACDPNLKVDPARVWELANDGTPQGRVPPWAKVVVAGVDTGKRDHPYVVRAFGSDFQSQLLEYGVARSSVELLHLLDRSWHGPGGQEFKIRRMMIDSGGGQSDRTATRTEDVYRLAAHDPARIYAIKGWGGLGKPKLPISTSRITYRPRSDQHAPGLDIRLSVLDTQHWKDLTAGYIAQGVWYPYPGVSRDYVMQVASERKVLKETKILPDNTRQEVWRWEVRVSGAPNHAWDCEVYATAAAHMVGVDQMVDEPNVVDDYQDAGGGWAGPQSFTRGGSWI